jgi:hypothetical protein
MLTAFDPLTPERMSMAQAPLRTDSHMQNYEAHVKAVEEDLEYYRCKRVEPRITYFIRRGIIRLYDLLQATPAAVEAVAGARDAAGPDEDGHDHQHEELEQRIRRLEDRLDDYVRANSLVTPNPGTVDLVIDDGRKGPLDE